MYHNIIQTHLSQYPLETFEDEQDALKEILQEIILYALSTANFFHEAAFCGGTSLRILHNLPRFSEDLDFILNAPNPEFQWEPYLNAIENACQEFGIEPEVIDKSELGKSVQKMFLKDNSIGKILDLRFHHHPGKKLRVKLEIDTNPPNGAALETSYISFPLDCSITTLDLPSNFAGKCHALLCRKYLKGRDWYDFTWYIKNKIIPNLNFLSSALMQQGPWASKKITLHNDWLTTEFNKKIESIQWEQATQDVAPFLKGAQKKALNLWSKYFFKEKVKHFSEMLKKGKVQVRLH